MLRMVDFPQPEGPTSATNSLSRMSKETCETAGTSRGPWMKVFERSRMLMRTIGPPPYDLNLACAFLTKLMSTAFAYGMGLSTASGTQTFMPRS